MMLSWKKYLKNLAHSSAKVGYRQTKLAKAKDCFCGNGKDEEARNALKV